MHFLKYLCKKLIYLISSLFVISTLTFILMKIVPGDPFAEEQSMRADVHEALMKKHGMDQPLLIQYKNYLTGLLKVDLGYSLKYNGRRVNDIIRVAFPVSAALGLQAFAIAASGGIFLGMLAAFRAGKWTDHFILGFLILAVSIPSFIIATLLQYFFAIHLELFPIARWGTFNHTILPAFALAAFPMAFIARMTRSNLLGVLKSDYIKAALAKGLPPLTILRRHALPHAITPVLSYIGQLLASILVGSFIIEKIYSIPGLGQWLVNSVSNRDYALIMGLTLFYSTILMVSVFVVDIAYGFFDPRIRLTKQES